ncbi:hypothetical protein NC651_033958 [Populus alba x Populus x berolinensis]|nr:hypothetical protein NC651_033958 [Populus alba x Populus x berolinensis]
MHGYVHGVGLGLRVFKNMPNRNILSYKLNNLSGLGFHATFSLSACCHSGLDEFCSRDRIEHYFYIAKLLRMEGDVEHMLLSLKEPLDSGMQVALMPWCKW